MRCKHRQANVTWKHCVGSVSNTSRVKKQVKVKSSQQTTTQQCKRYSPLLCYSMNRGLQHSRAGKKQEQESGPAWATWYLVLRTQSVTKPPEKKLQNTKETKTPMEPGDKLECMWWEICSRQERSWWRL